jgi:hypothetical protein
MEVVLVNGVAVEATAQTLAGLGLSAMSVTGNLNSNAGGGSTAPTNGARLVNCFPPSTLVGTEAGLRPIGQIGAGEAVWGYDFLSGDWRLCLVECRHDANYHEPLVTIDLGDGEVTATVYHPFWVIQGDGLADRPTPRHVRPDEDQGGSLAGRWVNSHDLFIINRSPCSRMSSSRWSAQLTHLLALSKAPLPLRQPTSVEPSRRPRPRSSRCR